MLGTDPQKESLPKANVVGITLCADISEGKKCSAPPAQTRALGCTPSFECFIPQQGAAGAEGKNRNGKRKKEVLKGEQKLGFRISAGKTWSKGTADGTTEDCCCCC